MNQVKTSVILATTIGLISLGFFYFVVSSQTEDKALLDMRLSSDNYEAITKTFSDVSGLGNNMISSNPAVFDHGKYGKNDGAMNFNGTSDYIKTDNVIVSSPTALTISGWFRKEAGGSTYECVLHQGSDTSIGNSSYWLGVSSDDYLTATIGARTGVGWAAGKTTVPVVYGQWYHVLATWDGTTVSVYVNGALEKQYALGSYASVTNNTRIGDSGNTYQFSGLIEEVSILNYYLSAEEVRGMYETGKAKAGLATKSQGLVAYWNMDKKDFIEGTRNYSINPDAKLVYNTTPGNYQPGWDATLQNDAILVNSWGSGYNSGVGSANIGYHAKWVYEGIEGDGDAAMKFIDRNDLYGLGHRWLGISQGIGSPASLGWNIGDTITVSWWQKADVLNKGARPGLYHKLLSTGGYSFEDNIRNTVVTQAGKWERHSFTTVIGSNWDLSAGASLYVYGHFGSYGTLWVDNLQVEKKDNATPFVVGTRTGNLTDKTPYDNNGGSDMQQSFIFTEDRFGRSNSAITFSGYNNFLDYGKPLFSTSNSNHEMTVTAWVNPSALGQEQWIISQYDASSARFIWSVHTDGRLRYFRGGSAVFSNTPLSTGEWQFVVATKRSDGTINIYLNGVADGSGVLNGYFGDVNTKSGNSYPSYNPAFSLDELRVYDRVLTESEINTLYESYNSKTIASSIRGGLLLDMPLSKTYTKTELPGSELLTNRTPYSITGQNYGGVFNGDLSAVEFSYASGNTVQSNFTTQDFFSDNDSFTLSFWTKLTAASTVRSGLVNMNKYYTEGTAGGFGVMLNQANQFAPHMSTDATTYAISSTSIPLNEWQHVLIKYENGTLSFFQNGEFVSSTGGSWKVNSQPLLIGRGSQGGWGSSSDAEISNILIYDRALTDEEVKTLYDRGRLDAGIIIQPKSK